MSYSDLLKDPRWQRKRLEALEFFRWSCSKCGAGDKTLNVHHLKYRKGAKPWEYELGELDVRCEGCHGELHALRDELDQILSRCSYEGELLMDIIAYAETRVAILEFTGNMVNVSSPARAYGCAGALGVKVEWLTERVKDGVANVCSLELDQIEEFGKRRRPKLSVE